MNVAGAFGLGGPVKGGGGAVGRGRGVRGERCGAVAWWHGSVVAWCMRRHGSVMAWCMRRVVHENTKLTVGWVNERCSGTHSNNQAGYGDTGSLWVNTRQRANILGGAGGGAGGPALSHSFVARLVVHPLGTPCAEIHSKHSVSCWFKAALGLEHTPATQGNGQRFARCAVQGSAAVLCKVRPLCCASCVTARTRPSFHRTCRCRPHLIGDHLCQLIG